MPHPAPQRDRTTIAMIMRGNRSATDNIWPEAARGHLARGRISGQRPCDRPRTVSSKARGQILQFVWVYWRLQLIVLWVTDFFLDPCCWRVAQAPLDHLHEEPFFHSPLTHNNIRNMGTLCSDVCSISGSSWPEAVSYSKRDVCCLMCFPCFQGRHGDRTVDRAGPSVLTPYLPLCLSAPLPTKSGRLRKTGSAWLRTVDGAGPSVLPP